MVTVLTSKKERQDRYVLGMAPEKNVLKGHCESYLARPQREGWSPEGGLVPEGGGIPEHSHHELRDPDHVRKKFVPQEETLACQGHLQTGSLVRWLSR